MDDLLELWDDSWRWSESSPFPPDLHSWADLNEALEDLLDDTPSYDDW